jgi:hypothetical protein
MTRCIDVNSFVPVAPFSSNLQAEILHNTDVLEQCLKFLGILTTPKRSKWKQ